MYFMPKTILCDSRSTISKHNIFSKGMCYLNKKYYEGLKFLKTLVSQHHKPVCPFYMFNHDQSQCKVHSLCTLNTHISIRKIYTSVLSRKGDRSFYEPDKKGRRGKKQKLELKDLREGFWQIKTEVRKWREEMKEKFEADCIYVRPGDTDIVFHFETEEDIKRWTVTSDSDHNEGLSYGSLVLSPSGKGLFSGKTDTKVKEDGKIKNAGYSNMTVMQPMRSFMREKTFNWLPYTHLVMRVRGDGRRYLINLLTPGEFDITWFDLYNYVLYTRGGPYWQDVKIPFSKFFWSAKGRTQDRQCPLALNRVKRLGISAGGNITGPFRLEIDYIGVHFDPTHSELFAYEMYEVPSFII